MVSPAEILGARILVVDDQHANVSLLEGMLRIAGYTSIDSTTNPNEVCELHRQNRYCLILLDLQMPGMDGFQVMEGLKEVERDGYLPVLVITARRTNCALSKPVLRISSASRSTWLSCGRASITSWKCACCTGGWKKRSGNWSEAAR